MIPDALKGIKQVFTLTTGLPEDNNHDPSNIIFHDGKYHLWVTQHRNDKPYDHFRDCKIVRVSSEDGIHWAPPVDALLPSTGGWDSAGVLTANVFAYDGKYYMVYTGVDQDYGITHEKRYCGLAVADRPDAEFSKLQDANPIIGPSGSGWDADSADDVTILPVKGGFRLYYKGGPAGCDGDDFKIGAAFSESITGPYIRYSGNPISKGHAFAIWPFQNGYLLLTGLKDGDEGKIYGQDWDDPRGTQSLYWSEDGLHFEPAIPAKNRAAGVWPGDGKNLTTCWGVTVKTHETHYKRYIARFDFVAE